MMKIIILSVAAAVSYLLGGVNGAILASKLFHHEDIRDFGSKNPGFTNYKRVYGNGFVTWMVLIFDIVKTAVPVCLTAVIMWMCYDEWQFGAQFAGLCAMLGHCFPVWYRFKGGKAFMAGFATIWFVDWRMTLAATALYRGAVLSRGAAVLRRCEHLGRADGDRRGGAGDSAPLPEFHQAHARRGKQVLAFRQEE